MAGVETRRTGRRTGATCPTGCGVPMHATPRTAVRDPEHDDTTGVLELAHAVGKLHSTTTHPLWPPRPLTPWTPTPTSTCSTRSEVIL